MTRSFYSLLLATFAVFAAACSEDNSPPPDDVADDEVSEEPSGSDEGDEQADQADDQSDDEKNDTAERDGSVRDAGRGGSMDAGRTADGGNGSGPTADASPSDSGTVPGIDAATLDAGLDAGGPSDAALEEAPDGGGTANRRPGFVNLAPALGAPLDPERSTAVVPAPPSGWRWYEIAGAVCRDGSPNGIYVRFTASDKLLVYLEGGGACSSPGFCDYNPANVNEVLSGDGQTLLTSVLGTVAGRQQPGTEGIFDVANPANPFVGWNMVYVPYCTGDVHFGTRSNVRLPGVDQPQQFVGHLNMQKFIARIVPTFQDKVDRVVLAGASAGGFGTLLNFSLVQDAFADVPVVALDDSGPAFTDKYLPVCLQKRWRELWGFDAALPSDCIGCFAEDGGGLVNLSGYLATKHPKFATAIVSSTEDEIIRAFFSSGLNECANFETASPVDAALGQSFGADQYTAGLLELRTTFEKTKLFSSYYVGTPSLRAFHQHLWRPRFYEAIAGSPSMAEWTSSFLRGEMQQVGP